MTVGPSQLRGDIEVEAAIRGAQALPTGASVGPDSLYIIGYTSGTTGRPKGAMLTHRTTLASGWLNAFSLRFSGHTTHALTGSMSFVSVVPAHILSVLTMGGTVLMIRKWDVAGLVDLIAREHATFTYLPTPVLPEFAEVARRRPADLSSLRSLVHSGSRADPAALNAVRSAVGRGRFIEAWGMTEHSGAAVTATAIEDPNDSSEAPDTSVGRATVHTSVRLVDSDGVTELPWDGTSVGELVVSSPAVMTGYWRNPEASHRALALGWYRTGDLGSIDARGFVTIHERRTDLIISGGMNIYPSEVEHCIQQLAQVREVCVVDEPHERWGRTVVAVVVRRDGSDLTEAAVVEHCRQHMASYKKPSRVVFVDELPKTVGLKVARAKVRDAVQCRGGSNNPTAGPELPPAQGKA
jgi:acyl-CoA synthetase (AMP-forming)/AMP-acid ligase II